MPYCYSDMFLFPMNSRLFLLLWCEYPTSFGASNIPKIYYDPHILFLTLTCIKNNYIIILVTPNIQKMYYSPHHLVTTDEKKQKASTTIPCGNNKNNYHHTMDNLMPEKKTLQCTDKIIILWCLPIKKTPKNKQSSKTRKYLFLSTSFICIQYWHRTKELTSFS